MAERFYCGDAQCEASQSLVLVGDEAHHLARVRRIGVGAIVELFDGRGFATRAAVVSIARNEVVLRPEGLPLLDRLPPFRLILATAVPKGDRLDWLVEKATELGVDRFVPILNERSVVSPGLAKLARLRRNVIEASKQCGRNRLMTIDEPLPWPELLRSFGAIEPRLVAHPGGVPFGLWPRPRAGSEAIIALGPEGGFTSGEINAAKDAGWGLAGLGATVLRMETAGLSAAVRLLALGECEGED